MNEEAKNKDTLIKILEAGQVSEFWGTLLAIMDQNRRFLEHQIITKTSLEEGCAGEPLSDMEVDKLRYKREALMALMESPQKLLSQLTKEGDVEQEELDPFYTSIEQLRRDEV